MSTMSNVNDAFSAFNELFNAVQGMPMTVMTGAANANDAAVKAMNVEINNVVSSYKASIKRVLSTLNEDQVNQLNIQTISRLFSEDYKASLLKMITE
jgi:hypothetical protein